MAKHEATEREVDGFNGAAVSERRKYPGVGWAADGSARASLVPPLVNGGNDKVLVKDLTQPVASLGPPFVTGGQPLLPA